MSIAKTTLQGIFDIKRLPSQATYRRFFHKFSWERNNEVFPKLQHKFLEQINVGALTIDLDSTVITRYGNQEVLQNKEIGLIRADSGFYSNGFLEWFEERELNYIISSQILSKDQVPDWCHRTMDKHMLWSGCM